METLPRPVLLWDQPRAPNPRRLDIVLAEKAIEIPRQTVDLIKGEHKAPRHLAEAGWPTLPALKLSDGTVLTETVAISRYVEALVPEPNMLGRGPLEIALVEMWQRRVEFGLFATVTQAFRHTNPHMGAMETQVPDWGEVNRQRIPDQLARLEARLEGRAYLALDRPTVADATAIVAIDFLRILRMGLPPGLDRLAAYVERLHARPAFAPPGRAR